MKSGRAWLVGVLASVFLLVLPAAAWGGNMDLNQDDNGTTVQMAAGQFLNIELPSNPSTGFGWQYVVRPDSAVLVQTAMQYTPASTGATGAGGTHRWQFLAMRAGSTAITLVYERPWRGVPVRTFTVQVSVTNGNAGTNWVAFRVAVSYWVVDGQTPGAAMDDASPFIYHNRVYIPVRVLANTLGLTDDDITWNQADQTIVLKGAAATVQMTVGQGSMTVNGTTEPVDATPILRQGSTYVPARYLAKAFGYQVAWDAENQAVVGWPQGQAEPDTGTTLAWLTGMAQADQ